MSKEQNWLDGVIGWDPEFNSVETCFPDDPAIDVGGSDFVRFYEDNFNMEHLHVKDGLEPVKVVISLPTSSQWASVQGMFQSALSEDSEEDFSDKQNLVAKKLFEMCVRFPDNKSAKPVYRDGMKRLPEKVMNGLVRSKSWWVYSVGMWLVGKYLLSEDEKKVLSPESTEKTS